MSQAPYLFVRDNANLDACIDTYQIKPMKAMYSGRSWIVVVTETYVRHPAYMPLPYYRLVKDPRASEDSYANSANYMVNMM